MGRELHTIGIVKSPVGVITIVNEEDDLYAKYLNPHRSVKVVFHSAYLSNSKRVKIKRKRY